MQCRRLNAIMITTALAGAGAVLAAAPAQASDDYPYRASATGARDPWGFTVRECVSFAAWRLHQAGQSGFANAMSRGGHSAIWGNADHWDDAARILGFGVGSTPKVGAIAQWNANERTSYTRTTTLPGGATQTSTYSTTAGPYGHVGVVARVNSDGTVVVEQYNAALPHGYSSETMRAPRFLYISGVSGKPDGGVTLPSSGAASTPRQAANPVIRLGESSSGGVVTLTARTFASSAGRTMYFFRRSGLTGRVLPYGTATISPDGSARRVTREQSGQTLSLYAKDTAVFGQSPYSNDLAFRVH